MRIYLIAGLIKNILNRMSHYFPKPFGGDINVKIDLFNYTTKTDLKKQQKLIHLI